MVTWAPASYFAFAALFAWPLVAVFLYQTRTFAEATIWTILGALLLLPSGVYLKIATIPAFDKTSIPNCCALIGCLSFAARQKRVAAGFGLVGILVIAYIFSPLFTSALNNDPIVAGGTVIPGVGYYDGISAVLSQLIVFLPFFIGRRFMQSSSDNEAILRAMAIGGLLYSLPILLEIRLSPQLSNWIYGKSETDFVHAVRYGGYRPVVFMINGLATSFFVTTAFLAAVSLRRAEIKIRKFSPTGVTAYLGVIVVLCKSAGVLTYAVTIGPCLALLKPKAQLRIAAVIVAIGLLYPALRTANLFPTNAVLELSAFFSEERAASLKYRFDQEQELLAHAMERPVFGWGRYGRNRVYSEDSGGDVSTTDGFWIIILGELGIVGFLAQFGLLALPVFRALSSLKFIQSRRDRGLTAALAVIVALDLIEQIPNASISPWSWLLAGALLGRAEAARVALKRHPESRLVSDRLEAMREAR